jgi:hypothetical protein
MIVATTIAVMATAMLAVGCGGGSDSDAGERDSSQTTDAQANQVKNEVEASKPGEPEASKAFLKPGDKKSLAKFGEEASANEREAASKVLEENFKAREAGDWETQCSTLTPGAVEDVGEVASIQGIDGGGCAKELKARAEPLQQTKSLRANSLTGPIDALRFKGNRAYALYHGVGGQDYAMPMEKVDGEWKVDDLLEEEP